VVIFGLKCLGWGVRVLLCSYSYSGIGIGVTVRFLPNYRLSDNFVFVRTFVPKLQNLGLVIFFLGAKLTF